MLIEPCASYPNRAVISVISTLPRHSFNIGLFPEINMFMSIVYKKLYFKIQGLAIAHKCFKSQILTKRTINKRSKDLI